MSKLLIHQERKGVSSEDPESLKEHAHQTMSTSKASQEKKKYEKEKKEKNWKIKRKKERKKERKKRSKENKIFSKVHQRGSTIQTP